MNFYSNNHSILAVVAIVVVSILLVPCNLYKVNPNNISLVATLIGTCTNFMLGNPVGVLVRFNQLVLINVFEYVIPTTYSISLPVIQLKMDALTALLWIQHALIYFSSVLVVIAIHFQTNLGYMYLCT